MPDLAIVIAALLGALTAAALAALWFVSRLPEPEAWAPIVPTVDRGDRS